MSTIYETSFFQKLFVLFLYIQQHGLIHLIKKQYGNYYKQQVIWILDPLNI